MAEKNKRWTPERVKERIRIGMIVNRFQQCVAGRIEMSPAQVAAGKALMSKVLPDMTAQTVTQRPLEGMDDGQLRELIRSVASALAAQGPGSGTDDAREPAAAPSLPTVQ